MKIHHYLCDGSNDVLVWLFSVLVHNCKFMTEVSEDVAKDTSSLAQDEDNVFCVTKGVDPLHFLNRSVVGEDDSLKRGQKFLGQISAARSDSNVGIQFG